MESGRRNSRCHPDATNTGSWWTESGWTTRRRQSLSRIRSARRTRCWWLLRASHLWRRVLQVLPPPRADKAPSPKSSTRVSSAAPEPTVTTYPVNWWLVKRGLKHGMGGEARARLRHSVSAASKLATTFLTLAMLAGGVALAARYGDFSMRAGDRMEMGKRVGGDGAPR